MVDDEPDITLILETALEVVDSFRLTHSMTLNWHYVYSDLAFMTWHF